MTWRWTQICCPPLFWGVWATWPGNRSAPLTGESSGLHVSRYTCGVGNGLFLLSVLVTGRKRGLKLIQCWLECRLANLISVSTAHMVCIFWWFWNFTVDSFVHLSQHICGGPWSIPVVLSEKALVNFEKLWTENLLNQQVWFVVFFLHLLFRPYFFSSFFKIHMHLPYRECILGKTGVLSWMKLTENCFISASRWYSTTLFYHLSCCWSNVWSISCCLFCLA